MCCDCIPCRGEDAFYAMQSGYYCAKSPIISRIGTGLCPTLPAASLIYGSLSKYRLDERVMEQFKAAWPDVRTYLIDGASHHPHAEKANAFNPLRAGTTLARTGRIIIDSNLTERAHSNVWGRRRARCNSPCCQFVGGSFVRGHRGKE